MNAWLISLLVNNHFGVLTRVTGLFSRRGYNIASLSVGETHDPRLSRITIETNTNGAGINQVMKQLQKLEDVKKVRLLPRSETVEKELLLVKLVAPPARRERLFEDISSFSYQIPYADEGRVVLEFTGSPEQCGAFLDAIKPNTVLELCRTGITAISTADIL
ncbi:MAG: acetolactate synthase small subunit [Oscillospiraceae bacterium]|nr:acetolactate synthase small subunit [Oscillospiraceae bacterium]